MRVGANKCEELLAHELGLVLLNEVACVWYDLVSLPLCARDSLLPLNLAATSDGIIGREQREQGTMPALEYAPPCALIFLH